MLSIGANSGQGIKAWAAVPTWPLSERHTLGKDPHVQGPTSIQPIEPRTHRTHMRSEPESADRTARSQESRPEQRGKRKQATPLTV